MVRGSVIVAKSWRPEGASADFTREMALYHLAFPPDWDAMDSPMSLVSAAQITCSHLRCAMPPANNSRSQTQVIVRPLGGFIVALGCVDIVHHAMQPRGVNPTPFSGVL